MKIRVGHDITTGELFLGTKEQMDRYGIHYSKQAYFETFVGDQAGHVSDKIAGHVEPFTYVIVKSSTLTSHKLSWEASKEYTSISARDITLLPDYDESLLDKINEMRNANEPITKAFKLLGLTTAEEQELFAAQWYSENEKFKDDETIDPVLTQLTFTRVQTKTETYVFNQELTLEQLDEIKKNMLRNNGDFRLYEEKDNQLIPHDLKMNYLHGNTTT